MDSDYLHDLFLPYECPPFFAEDKNEKERNPLMELFPDTLAMSLNTLDHYSDPQLQLFEDLVIEPDLGSALSEIQIEYHVPATPKQEPKKRGRPRKNELSPAEPSRKCSPSVEIISERKKKKRKCMSQVEKAQHNHLERERRKGMTMLLEGLRELVPAVSDDKKASQKKIVDEATKYLKKEKPIFLSYLKEKQRYITLETKRRKLEAELASGPKGVLIVWEERRGMSVKDLHKSVVKRPSREHIRDEKIDEAIRQLESFRPRSPGSPSQSSDDSEEEHINVEV